MTASWHAIGWVLLLVASAHGHVVTQIFGEWKSSEPQQIEVLFDAGYAVPELRGDVNLPAPDREWLLAQGEAGWAAMRKEAELYLRECLVIEGVQWQVEFPDFGRSPPDFPELLNDGAYFRMKLTGDAPLESISWREGGRPSLVLKVGDGYLTIAPGDSARLAASPLRGSWAESFRQGFLHVVPQGLDHVLFVLGLFFYRREWRPLLEQSLAFTVAHTVTLGLAAAGWVTIGGGWVEPLIALSLVAVALENLRARNARSGLRLGVVFAFGLVHGLGFAGALSAWLAPGDGFLTGLVAANLGVEAAQASLLVVAWILTIPLHRTPVYPWLRVVACLAIATTGAVWAVQRIS